jgi:predicted nucleic acid-binding Zn ribbon protein
MSYLTMPPSEKAPQGCSRAVQTAGDGHVVGSRQCEVCGAALRGGQQVACSEKHRAERWRQKRAQAQQHRDDELRVLALAARQAIEALERRLGETP